MPDETKTDELIKSVNKKTNYSLSKIIILGIILFVFFLLIILAWWYYLDRTPKPKKVTKQNVAKVSEECGDLVADGGVTVSSAPFAPVLRAKITGLYDRTRAVCNWTVNGVSKPNTFSYKGYCIFKGETFTIPGKNKITYAVDYLSGCPKTATITVR